MGGEDDLEIRFADRGRSCQACEHMELQRRHLFNLVWVAACCFLTFQGSAWAIWTSSDRVGDTIYFLDPDEQRIDRFDLRSADWLPAIPTEAGATAFHATPGGLYVASGSDRSVIDYLSLDGATSARLTRLAFSFRAPVAKIAALEDYLILSSNERNRNYVLLVDRNTGDPLDPPTDIQGLTSGWAVTSDGSEVIYSSGEVFRRGFDRDLRQFGEGSDTSEIDFTFFGENWLFPDDSLIATGEGVVIDTATMLFRGRLANSIDDLAFDAGGQPVILSGSDLICFGADLFESGRVSLDVTASEIQVFGGDAYLFGPPGRAGETPTLQVVSVLAAEPIPLPEPSEPLVDPSDTQAVVFSDRDGEIFILNRSLRQFFRWSTARNQWLDPLLLRRAPTYVSYDAARHQIALAFADGPIEIVDLNQAERPSTPLYATLKPPYGILACDGLVVTSGGPGREALYVIDENGMLTDTLDRIRLRPNTLVWAAGAREFVFAEADSGSRLMAYSLSEAGRIGDAREDGTVAVVATRSISSRLRLSPDELRSAAGNTGIYGQRSLAWIFEFPEGTSYQDLVWSAANQVAGISASDDGDDSLVEIFAPYEASLNAPTRLGGIPLGIVAAQPASVHAITSLNGTPRIYTLEDGGGISYASPVPAVAPTFLTLVSRDQESLTLEWQNLGHQEAALTLDFQLLGSGESPDSLPLPAGAQRVTITPLEPKTEYEIVIRAVNELGASGPSAPLIAETLEFAGQPDAAPYNFSLSEARNESFTVVWDDHADNETGFLVYENTVDNSFAGAVVIAELPANSTSYSRIRPAGSGPSHLWVRALNGDIEGEISNFAYAQAIQSDVLTSAPDIDLSLRNSDGAILVSWIDRSLTEDGFIIYRLGDGESEYIEVGRVGPGGATGPGGLFVDTDVVPGLKYGYIVSAYNSLGEGRGSVTRFLRTPRVGGQTTLPVRSFGDVLYFPFSSPPRIERFDTVAGDWLAPLPVSDYPLDVGVHDGNVLVSIATQLLMIDPLSGEESLLADIAGMPISDFFVRGNYLFFSQRRKDNNNFALHELDLRSGTSKVVVEDYLANPIAVPGSSSVYMHGNGTLSQLDFAEDGSFLSENEFLSSRAGPPESQWGLFRNRTRLWESNGWIVDAADNSVVSDTEISADGAAFYGDASPVLFNRNQAKIDVLSSEYDLRLSLPISRDPFPVGVAATRDGILQFFFDGSNDHGVGVKLIGWQALGLHPYAQLETAEDSPLVIDPAELLADYDATLQHGLEIIRNDGILDIATDDMTLAPVPDVSGIATALLRQRGTDGLINSERLIELKVNPVPDAPRYRPLPPVTGPDDGTAITFAAGDFFSDPDSGDMVTFSIAGTGDEPIFSDLQIDQASGELKIGFAPWVSGTSVVTIRATDSTGRVADADLTVRLPEIGQPGFVLGEIELNRQTGLFEQLVEVTNTGARAIGGFDISVHLPPANSSVYNSSGGDATGWLVSHGRPLEPGASARATLEYYHPARSKLVPEISITHRLPIDAAVGEAGGANTFAVDRIVALGDGSTLVEFSARPGRCYQMQYRAGVIAGWQDSLVRIRAGGTRVQWVDDGPPKTATHPSTASRRLYRVIEKEDGVE